jgi:hypothetical protein
MFFFFSVSCEGFVSGRVSEIVGGMAAFTPIFHFWVQSVVIHLYFMNLVVYRYVVLLYGHQQKTANK